MDFNYLLELAEMNNKESKKTDAKFFPSKLSKAKKVERPVPNSEAVKALLDQKEKDKKEKNIQLNKEKKKLLESRSLDKKNKRKILAMINRTKGASKSVLDEAKDLITVNGEEQCDVDDYGYESTRSQQIFEKLTTGYREMPDDNRLKFKKKNVGDITDIKNRVINSLKVKYEEDNGIRKRTRTKKRKSKEEKNEFINDGDPYDGRGSKAEVKKSHQPIEEEQEVPVAKKIKKAMPPPMSFQDLLVVAKKKQSDPLPEPPKKEKDLDKPKERPQTAKEKAEKEEERLRKLRRLWNLPSTSSESAQIDKKVESTSAKPAGKSSVSKTVTEPKKEQKTIDRSKYFSVPSSKATPVHPHKENKSKLVKEPPKYLPVAKKPVKPQVQNRYSHVDSDEYDSEMDDFIDDGDVQMDISSEIGKIFGYDKSKYRHIDDEDDSSMVASYSQMQKEEIISAKLGLKEDLDDIKNEEMAKRKKKLRLQNSHK